MLYSSYNYKGSDRIAQEQGQVSDRLDKRTRTKNTNQISLVIINHLI